MPSASASLSVPRERPVLCQEASRADDPGVGVHIMMLYKLSITSALLHAYALHATPALDPLLQPARPNCKPVCVADNARAGGISVRAGGM